MQEHIDKGYTIKGFVMKVWDVWDVLLVNIGTGTIWLVNANMWDIIDHVFLTLGLFAGFVYGVMRIIWNKRKHDKEMEQHEMRKNEKEEGM